LETGEPAQRCPNDRVILDYAAMAYCVLPIENCENSDLSAKTQGAACLQSPP